MLPPVQGVRLSLIRLRHSVSRGHLRHSISPRKWMMKKNYQMIAALAAVSVLTLAACSRSSDEGAPADGNEGPSGNITITNWRFADPSAVGQLHLQLVEEFNDAQDAIFVEPIEVPYADVNTTLVNTALAGSPSDVFALSPAELANASEYLQSLDDYWAAEGDEFSSAFSQSAIDLASYDGHIYGVPVEQSTTDGLWYNTEVLEASGVDPEEAVKSWDHFMQALDKIQAAGFTPYIFEGADASRMDRHWSWYVSGGVDLSDPAKYVDQMCSPAAADTFEFLSNLYLDGYVANPAAIAYEEATRQFSAGDVGFYADGPWAPATYAAYNDEIGAKLGYTHLPPREEGGTYGANLDGLLWVLPKDSPNPDAGWELIKWMSSAEAQERQAENGNLPTRTAVLETETVQADHMLLHFGTLMAEHGYPRPRAPF